MKNLVNKLLRPLGVEVHGTGYLNMIRQKEFKRDPFDLQEQLLDKPASTIFDVGGHVGGMSLKYLKRFPSASIHTFEPFPDSFRELSQNVKDTPSIHPVEAAVSDHTDGATFFVNTKVDTNSLLPASNGGKTGMTNVPTRSHEIQVKTITLDAYCEQQNINQIDVLKMDIQGAELQALKGAKGLLEKQAIKVIYTEIWFQTQYENQAVYLDLGAYLKQFGYRIADFSNAYYLGNHLSWADAIFVPISNE